MSNQLAGRAWSVLLGPPGLQTHLDCHWGGTGIIFRVCSAPVPSDIIPRSALSFSDPKRSALAHLPSHGVADSVPVPQRRPGAWSAFSGVSLPRARALGVTAAYLGATGIAVSSAVPQRVAMAEVCSERVSSTFANSDRVPSARTRSRCTSCSGAVPERMAVAYRYPRRIPDPRTGTCRVAPAFAVSDCVPVARPGDGYVPIQVPVQRDLQVVACRDLHDVIAAIRLSYYPKLIRCVALIAPEFDCCEVRLDLVLLVQ